MGSPEEFEAIKGLYKEANDLLGNIVKVTPTSKAVGDLAIFMYKNNLNKDNILTAGASLSYPDSVVSYFQGMMGQPYGGFPKELQKIVLKDIEPLTERPGKLLPQKIWKVSKSTSLKNTIMRINQKKLWRKKQSVMHYIQKCMKTTANILKCIMM